ncbi:uncharacterized protein LOC132915228 isoform X2 [Bombus pascuorum]|uniref:uncharacterized protein LOC132915228 isoform X2 n=1 Tax=Bombus pascuorum TaxID=65598 RepID=UPI00298E2A2F|nr:uncharacterized protein LOC132915228 isoform X2 [Bombus pascuorum]
MGGASDTLAWSCLVFSYIRHSPFAPMPLQWGKSNKQHRATSQRSGAFTSQYSCHRAAFDDEDAGNGRRFVEVAPFVVGPLHRTPLSVWRRSTARRARRTSTPGVATPLLHATPSRPSSSSCLFSLCLQLAARISAPRGHISSSMPHRIFATLAYELSHLQISGGRVSSFSINRESRGSHYISGEIGWPEVGNGQSIVYADNLINE